MPSFAQVAALAALAALAAPALVSAHGYVDQITVDGEVFSGTSPSWIYQAAKPATAGWYANNQDNGFVEPASFGNEDIICHKSATPGQGSIPITAGSKIDISWSTWPESHHGPVITYLANCNGNCSSVDKTSLKFFKIHAGGLNDGSTAPGDWSSDDLIAANNTDVGVTIPSEIADGNYVLRHEIIALHSAGQENGAQAYPQCLNVEISGGGSANPEGVVGTELYTSTDSGILINIYQSLSSYEIPGPALYGGASNSSKIKRVPTKFSA